MDTPIIEMLKTVSAKARVRFCMPGHKGRGAFFDGDTLTYDITELPDADNLYAPAGAILQSEKLNSEFTGAKQSFFLVNGNSAGVSAAILSVLKPGDTVIAARDLHLSAVHAFGLWGADVKFINPGVDGNGMFGAATPQMVADAARNYPKAKAVYVTYPNYCGLCADLKGIAEAAHDMGLKLICDAAHAAAFDYSGLLPVPPSQAGCDIWSISLHKTLPAANQCAVLSIGVNSGIDGNIVRKRVNMLQTTSPSYLLLASIDYALAYMRKYGQKELSAAAALADEYAAKINRLGGYKCLRSTARDPLKLLIDVKGRGITGFEAADRLARAGVYVETADTSNILLMCGAANRPEDYAALFSALQNIDRRSKKIGLPFNATELTALYECDFKTDIRSALSAPMRRVPLENAVGRVSAVCAGAYPPGVPVVLPGQAVTDAAVNYLLKLKSSGCALFGADDYIDVISEVVY